VSAPVPSMLGVGVNTGLETLWGLGVIAIGLAAGVTFSCFILISFKRVKIFEEPVPWLSRAIPLGQAASLHQRVLGRRQ